MVKFFYGDANFASIRTGGGFYVDKTPFLPLLEDPEVGGKNLIFLRPRRFGKSLLLSMLRHYYDISAADQYDELFRGLWVHEHPTPEKNKHVVLQLNFSTVNPSPNEAELRANVLTSVRSGFSAMAGRYRGRYPELDEFFDEMRKIEDPAALVEDALGIFAGLNDKLYILIDEYDSFANALLSADQKELYEKVTDKMGFVRAFFRTLKAGGDSGAIARVFITGGTPILLDDLVSGFNVVRNISNHPRYNAMAGFTRADVERAVDGVLRDRPDLAGTVGDRDALLDMLERYYNGYRFSVKAKERMFNSTLVLYFLRELVDLGEFPAKMLDVNARTDYQKLHGLWASAGPAVDERRAVLEQLFSEGQVWSPLVDSFGVRSSTTSAEFVSLMYYTGMLTLAPVPADADTYLFESPNRVIRELAWEHYTKLLEDQEGVILTGRRIALSLLEMTKKGIIEPLLVELRKYVLPVLSNRDLRKHDEKAMKMLLIGLIVTTGLLHVLSEKEFAQGYNDLFLGPAEGVTRAKYAWMIELKYLATGASESEQQAALAQAEEQLRRYASDKQLVPMLTRGLQLKTGTLLFVGGKDVEWRELSLSA